MWVIKEEKLVLKQIKKAPTEIKKKYEYWKSILKVDGPKGVKRLTGFKDHALKGDWQGARSSYLNKQWRVIYFVDKEAIEILIIEVNPHDYRKKS